MVIAKSRDEAKEGKKKQNTQEAFCREDRLRKKEPLLSSRDCFPFKMEDRKLNSRLPYQDLKST